MKSKKLKNINRGNTDTNEIRTLVILTIIIIAIVTGLYFVTDKVLDNKSATEETETKEATISYTETIVGEMFNKPEKEYYVFAYSSEDDNFGLYNNLFSSYSSKDDSKMIYFIDLASKFNSGVLSDKSNSNPTNASEVEINGKALYLIKDGKVSKFYEKTEDIEKVLK